MKCLAVIAWLSLMLSTLAVAQSPADATPVTSQDLDFKVSTTQPWTDTGIELQAGDSLEITSNTSAPSAVPDRHALATVCDPRGAGSANQDLKLPVPDAPPGALLARLQQSSAPFLVGANKTL